jgi:hypothetical protein
MNNWVTKIWLPFLLIALVAAVYLEFGSVESFDPQVQQGPPGVDVPLKREPPLSSQGIQKASLNVESRLAVGERFGSLEELVADQDAAGFVRTGYFGKYWPARVVEIQLADDGIGFVRQNGVKHNYTKFDGYRMKMVRLNSGGKETIVVFRSRLKRR